MSQPHQRRTIDFGQASVPRSPNLAGTPTAPITYLSSQHTGALQQSGQAVLTEWGTLQYDLCSDTARPGREAPNRPACISTDTPTSHRYRASRHVRRAPLEVPQARVAQQRLRPQRRRLQRRRLGKSPDITTLRGRGEGVSDFRSSRLRQQSLTAGVPSSLPVRPY